MKRNAFTVIELLIVVSILAILFALSAGLAMQIRQHQRVTHTRQTVEILQKKLNGRVGLVIEKARSPKNPYRPSALALCNGDRDLADALLCYAHLSVEFPETFAQARQGFPMLVIYTDPPRPMPPAPRFANVPEFTTLSGYDQAAALLYISLQDDLEGLENEVGNDSTVKGPNTFFKDSFGRPILFQRWFQNSETNQPPLCVTRGAFKDHLDPMGKLSNWSGLGTMRLQAGCPTAGDNNNKIITIVSNTLPNGETVWGYQSPTR